MEKNLGSLEFNTNQQNANILDIATRAVKNVEELPDYMGGNKCTDTTMFFQFPANPNRLLVCPINNVIHKSGNLEHSAAMEIPNYFKGLSGDPKIFGELLWQFGSSQVNIQNPSLQTKSQIYISLLPV